MNGEACEGLAGVANRDRREIGRCVGLLHGPRALVPVLLLCLAACAGPDPQETFAEAELSFAAHDYRTARIQLQNVLQADSQHLPARILFGRLALATGDLAEADRQLGVARDLGAAAADISVAFAEIMLARNDRAAASAMLDQVPAESRGADYWRVRGVLELGAGDVARALSSLDQAAAIGGETPELLTARAQAAIGAGELERAEQLIGEALSLDSSDPMALRFRSGLNLARGRVNEAATDLRAAADVLEQRGQLLVAAPVLLQLVRLDLAGGNLDSARAAAGRVASLAGGSSPLANYALGLVAYATGEYPEAIRLMQTATNNAPEVPDFVTLLGAAHLAAGNLGQAEQAFRALLDMVPASVPATRLLAETQLRQQRPAAALETLGSADVAISLDPGVSMLRGIAHLENGEPEQAIVNLREALERAPGSPAAVLQLARAYNAAGRAEEAAELLRSSPLAGDGASDAQDLQEILSRLGAGDRAGAADYVAQVVAGNPGDPRPLTISAAFHRLVNERTEARDDLDRALAIDPAYPQAHLVYAVLLAEEGLVDQAELRFQRVLEIDPGNQAALMSLAQIAFERDDLELAERYLTTAVASADSARTRLALARLYARAGDIESAGREVEAAYELAPTDTDVIAARALLRARLRIDGGDLAGARGVLTEAAGAAPSLEILDLLADVELRIGNRAEALRLAARMQSEFERAANGFTLEARIRLLEGQYPDAVRLFERALQLERSSSNFLGIVTARRAMGQEDVLEQVQAWLAESPEDTAVRSFLAETFLADDRPAEALDEYEAILERDAEHLVALNNAAWIAHSLGRPDSIGFANRAVAVAPDNAAVLDTLGWILTQQGRPAEGIAYLERAVALGNPDPAIRFHLAQAQAALGQVANARSSLQQLLRGDAEFPERAAAEALLQTL